MRVVVLGGSTPFTAGLVDAIQQANAGNSDRVLVLHGRNEENLAIVGRHASESLRRLGWSVRWTTQLDEAVEGADCVVHQIRYGGLELRARTERMCADEDVICDETLGPAALITLLASVREIRKTATTIEKTCPDAWVLNLTNPLSVVTSLMLEAGVARCYGVCELPQLTAHLTAGVLGLSPEQLEWSYTGLNHRGFVHDLVSDGHDQWEELLERLAGRSIGGVDHETIQQLGAVPVKYFSLMQGRPISRIGRAAFLEKLRQKLLDEMTREPGKPPPSLNKRAMDWYGMAVLPLVRALGSDQIEKLSVNVVREDGVAWECLAQVSQAGVKIEEGPSPPPAVAGWVQTFLRHERACLQSVDDPSERHIEEVLRADPVVEGHRIASLVNAIVRMLDR